MSRRASIFGTGSPGGAVEYRGDVTAPVRSYASALPNLPLTSRLFNPPSTNRTNSAVVVRAPRRKGQIFFYSHGAVPMPKALPGPGRGTAIGGVESSVFQPYNIQLMDWQNNTAWYDAGYPRNLGYSTRVPQLVTKASGAPGNSQMDQRPLFTKVQRVPRPAVTTRTYPTRSAGS